MAQLETKKTGFTRKEMRSFRNYALFVAAIGAGMFAVAPKGMGQVLGILFSVLLLPVPPSVIYLIRRCRPTNETAA